MDKGRGGLDRLVWTAPCPVGAENAWLATLICGLELKHSWQQRVHNKHYKIKLISDLMICVSYKIHTTHLNLPGKNILPIKSKTENKQKIYQAFNIHQSIVRVNRRAGGLEHSAHSHPSCPSSSADRLIHQGMGKLEVLAVAEGRALDDHDTEPRTPLRGQTTWSNTQQLDSTKECLKRT